VRTIGVQGMTLSILVTLCAVITVLILSGLAFAFRSNPARGLVRSTHRVELPPLVMADRYTAFAHARAGHPHKKHTFSGVLSVIALGVTLAALVVEKGI
jgi:hypothetical protein